MNDHVELDADDLKTIRKALRCPAKLVKSDAERTFLKETKERLEAFGERIFVSEKQLAWLRKIAGRAEGGKKSGSKPPQRTAEIPDDLPIYGELAGE